MDKLTLYVGLKLLFCILILPSKKGSWGSYHSSEIAISFFYFIEILLIYNVVLISAPSWTTALSWRRGLYNSVKVWALLWRAQDGRVIMESSDKTLTSAVQQSDSVTLIYIVLHILSHYGLSQDIKYSSLCSTLLGPCCLSILYIIVSIHNSLHLLIPNCNCHYSFYFLSSWDTSHNSGKPHSINEESFTSLVVMSRTAMRHCSQPAKMRIKMENREIKVSVSRRESEASLLFQLPDENCYYPDGY